MSVYYLKVNIEIELRQTNHYKNINNIFNSLYITTVSTYRYLWSSFFFITIELTTPTLHVLILVLLWTRIFSRLINIHWIIDEYGTLNCWSGGMVVLWCKLILLSLAGIQCNRDGWSWPFLRLYWSPKKKRSVKRYRKHMQVVKLKYYFFILNYSF